jgi:NADH-quinone oxidoreductase subunit D
MGPQHPSTHGVLRLVVELEGETVTSARTVIGYLHTGIEKNLEYRNWVQGVTFVTRMDYLSCIFNETGYCLAVEKLLGIEPPPRATTIRVLTMELQRIASHMVALATGGMELGALTAMTNGFRERELVLDALELITGLRMNHAYIRPGGVAQDLPEGAVEKVRELLEILPARFEASTSCSSATRSGRTAPRASATSTSRRASRSGSPARCCAPPASPGTCARPTRTAATRPTTSTSSPAPAATPTAASCAGSASCASR